jgi:RNase P subunit RPR2
MMNCPNCGSEKRYLLSTSTNNHARERGKNHFKGHVNSSKYMCLKCGFIYRGKLLHY